MIYKSALFKAYTLSESTVYIFQAPWTIDGNTPPMDWPHSGAVAFKNYSTRYRPGLDLILKNISVNVNPSEKVMFLQWILRIPSYFKKDNS